MISVKLETLHKKLIEQIKRYPDYQIGEYFNSEYSCIRWFGVFDYDTQLRVAEVIAVEKFAFESDSSLLVIDYVNSDSRRYTDIEEALSFIESILIVASDRKKANKNEGEWQPWKSIPIKADKITTNTIGNINKVYLVTGRHNGKTLFYKNLLKNLFGFEIKDVIFNNPATVVFWEDGEKTVVQCQNGEEFDPEKGLAMAISKKIYGNKHDYYDVFKKWIGKYKKKSKTKNPREESFNDYLNEQLKDPEFKKHYDEVVAEEENNNET